MNEFTVVIVLFSITSLVALTWLERHENIDIAEINTDKDKRI